MIVLNSAQNAKCELDASYFKRSLMMKSTADDSAATTLTNSDGAQQNGGPRSDDDDDTAVVICPDLRRAIDLLRAVPSAGVIPVQQHRAHHKRYSADRLPLRPVNHDQQQQQQGRHHLSLPAHLSQHADHPAALRHHSSSLDDDLTRVPGQGWPGVLPQNPMHDDKKIKR